MSNENKLLISIIEKYWPKNITEKEALHAFIRGIYNLNTILNSY